jgi:hypothetical protein
MFSCSKHGSSLSASGTQAIATSSSVEDDDDVLFAKMPQLRSTLHLGVVKKKRTTAS